jgi:excisionase family DNA binding protein
MAAGLVTVDDIAELLGVSRRTIERYLADEDLDFPEPAASFGRVRVWKRRDVERWAKKTLPLPQGRPPKTD